jgi:UDP-N-acetylmuramoyl-L-alanyl-D-glutamate--2,6-diaminopimelate ligase
VNVAHRLDDLVAGAAIAGDGGVAITGLTADSRAVRPGFLFAALPGAKTDGARFVDDALARGAVAVLAAPGAVAPRPGFVLVTDPDPRRRLALAAARLHPRQPATMAAVTGTNGKTSVAQFARQIWAGMGREAASIGTLGVIAPGVERPLGMTTPDPVELHRVLDELAASGVVCVAMEASSHGLDQRRLDGVRIAAAGFTNITRDHLDYHGDEESYWQAKRRLFAELLPPGGAAVVNAESPRAPELAALAKARGHRLLTVGTPDANLALLERRPNAIGQTLRIVWEGRARTVELPLAGAFQASNALVAAGLVLATGGESDKVFASIEKLRGVPGRMERAALHPCGAPVYVDYAHTPDALETILQALRPHTERRLVVVFGAGGDRDPGKRPQMGAIAAKLADGAIVTDDNPRSEDPAEIRRAILAAAPGAIEIGDREAAIRAAVARLEKGDVLVIAGKGHEQGQTAKGVTRPFDDREVARAAVAALGGAALGSGVLGGSALGGAA